METGDLATLPYDEELTSHNVKLMRTKQLGQEECDLTAIMIKRRCYVLNTASGQHKQLVFIINDQGHYSFLSDDTLAAFKNAISYNDGKFSFATDNYRDVQLGQETLF